MKLHIFCLSLLLAIKHAACTEEACTDSCQTPLSYLTFNGTSPEDDYYVNQCTNKLRVQSLYICITERCTIKEINTGIDTWKGYCTEYGGVELLPYSILKELTPQQMSNLTVVGPDDLTAGTVYEAPVRVSDLLFGYSVRTINAWEESVWTRAAYGYAMYGFFAGVFLIAMLFRAYNYILITIRRRNRHQPDKTPAALTKFDVFLKKYITVPATFRYRCSQPVWWCTIPARMQSLTIAAFVIINVVLCAVRYDVFDNNLYWATTSAQVWRYIADRTGVMSMANMVLIWAFGMRNNVLVFLTGWSFSTFNQFHKWVARVATIEAIIHSVAYTVDAFSYGGYAEYAEAWAEKYWYMGGLATIVMSLLLVFSMYPIRQRMYEVFLLIHIVFAVLFLVGMYYHVEIFEGEYNGYIWPCVALWAFDRFVRIVRVVFLNKFPLKATISYNNESNLLRLKVPTRTFKAFQPGSYYFIYILHGPRLWESHPFTLSTWGHTAPGGDVDDAVNSYSQPTLCFNIRPFSSFTARMQKYAQSQASSGDNADGFSEGKVRAIIEGPYGPSHHLRNHHTVLLVIGGSGITVALAHLQDIHDTLFRHKQRILTRKIHLVWAVRDMAVFNDIYTHEMLNLLSGIASLTGRRQILIEIDVYITGTFQPARASLEQVKEISTKSHPVYTPTSQPTTTNAKVPATEEISTTLPTKEIVDKSSSSSSSIDGPSSLTDSEAPIYGARPGDRVHVRQHRPIVHDIVIESTRSAYSAKKNIGIVVCGPATMADDARAAVVVALKENPVDLDFYPEVFGW